MFSTVIVQAKTRQKIRTNAKDRKDIFGYWNCLRA